VEAIFASNVLHVMSGSGIGDVSMGIERVIFHALRSVLSGVFGVEIIEFDIGHEARLIECGVGIG